MVPLDDTTPTGSAGPERSAGPRRPGASRRSGGSPRSDGSPRSGGSPRSPWYDRLERWRRGLDEATEPTMRRMVVSQLDPPLSRRVTGEHEVIDVDAVEGEAGAAGRGARPLRAVRPPRPQPPRRPSTDPGGRGERPGLLPTTPMLSMTRGTAVPPARTPAHEPDRRANRPPTPRGLEETLARWPLGKPGLRVPRETPGTREAPGTPGGFGTPQSRGTRGAPGTPGTPGGFGTPQSRGTPGTPGGFGTPPGRRTGPAGPAGAGAAGAVGTTGHTGDVGHTGSAGWAGGTGTREARENGWGGSDTGWVQTGLRPTGLVPRPTRPLSTDVTAARTRARLARLGQAVAVLLALGLAWLVLVTLRSQAAEEAPVDVVGSRINDAVIDTLLADRVLSLVGWAANVATTLVLGGVIFRVFVVGARASVARDDRAAGSRVLRATAVVGIVAELASLSLRAASVSDVGFPAAWDLDTLRFVLTGRFGDAALLRIAGLALLAGFLPVLPIGPASRRPEPDGPGGADLYGSVNGHRLTRRRPRGRRVRGRGGWATPAAGGDRLVLERLACLVGGLVVLLSYAIVGHPQSSTPNLLLIPAQCVHITAVSTWFGGVTFLTIALRHQRREGTAKGSAELVARFSTLAGITVALAAATGLTMAYTQLETVGGLTSTAYGRALLVKLSTLAVPLTLGFYNRQRLVPAVVRRDEAQAWRQLRLTLSLEALFIALGVLLATAAMTSGGFP